MKKPTKTKLSLRMETVRTLAAIRGGFITDGDSTNCGTGLCMSSQQRTACTSGNCTDVCGGSTWCTQSCGANSNCGCTND